MVANASPMVIAIRRSDMVSGSCGASRLNVVAPIWYLVICYACV